MDDDKTHWKKGSRELYKNSTGDIEQIQEETTYDTTAERPLSSHLMKNSS